MSNIVFILGAGASADAGAPLMYDFLDKARDLYAANKVWEFEKQFAVVFEAISALQAVHSKTDMDLYNIESVFAAFEMGQLIGKLPGSTTDEQRKHLIASLKTVIQVTLEQLITYNLESADLQVVVPRGTYLRLATLLKNLSSDRAAPRCSVISFNYDLAFDVALNARECVYDYCITEPRHDGQMAYLKLHGSLNWAQCSECTAIVPQEFPRSYTASAFDAEPEKGSSQPIIRLPMVQKLTNGEVMHHERPVRPEPLVVPPTWNKTTYGAMTQVWHQAAEELGTAEIVFVIGYSLPDTDAFFRYLLALGLVGEKMIKKFVVVNPHVDVYDKFKRLLGLGARVRAEHIPERFDKAMPQIESQLTGPRSRILFEA